MGDRSKNTNPHVGERIRLLRHERKMTQEDLGKLVNKGGSTVRMWELRNSEPDYETILLLAKFFHVTTDYLLGRSDERYTPPTNIYDVDRLLVFEELGTVRAGFDGSVDEIPTGRKIEIPASMISGDKKDYFVLRVKGNSMYPRLLDGDTILCKRCDSVDSGSLAVVLYNGDEATVKKVNYVSGENWLELVPANPEYPTKRIEGADLELCRILGLVVKLIRDL